MLSHMHLYVLQSTIDNWGEPHINGIAMRELYIIIYNVIIIIMVRQSRKIISPA